MAVVASGLPVESGLKPVHARDLVAVVASGLPVESGLEPNHLGDRVIVRSRGIRPAGLLPVQGGLKPRHVGNRMAVRSWGIRPAGLLPVQSGLKPRHVGNRMAVRSRGEGGRLVRDVAPGDITVLRSRKKDRDAGHVDLRHVAGSHHQLKRRSSRSETVHLVHRVGLGVLQDVHQALAHQGAVAVRGPQDDRVVVLAGRHVELRSLEGERSSPSSRITDERLGVHDHVEEVERVVVEGALLHHEPQLAAGQVDRSAVLGLDLDLEGVALAAFEVEVERLLRRVGELGHGRILSEPDLFSTRHHPEHLVTSDTDGVDAGDAVLVVRHRRNQR